MNYSIENIDLSALPLSYPNSLIMLCRDFPKRRYRENRFRS